MGEEIAALMMTTMLFMGVPSMIYLFRRAERLERKEIRGQFTDLVKEKLDIIRTAIAMGRDGDEIADLDKRLEKLIGTEDLLKTLGKGKTDPRQEAKLQDVDIVSEVDRQVGSTESLGE